MSRFEVDTLKSVFAYHVVERIVAADANLDFSEVGFLQATYPLDAMVEAGFARETGELTPRFMEARDEALKSLPQLLDDNEKKELVTLFLDACVIDGELHAAEGSMLYESARLLGMGPQAFSDHLDTLTHAVGQVELPDPERDG